MNLIATDRDLQHAADTPEENNGEKDAVCGPTEAAAAVRPEDRTGAPQNARAVVTGAAVAYLLDGIA